MKSYFRIPIWSMYMVQSLPDEAAGRLFKQMFDCYLNAKVITCQKDDDDFTKAMFKTFDNVLSEERAEK